MPTPTSNSPFSQPPVASDPRKTFLGQFLFGVGLAAVVSLLGLIVWRLVQLPHLNRPAAKQRVATVRPVASPPQEIAVVRGGETEGSIPAAPRSLHNSGEDREQSEIGRKDPADAPPRVSEALTIDSDQLVEQRLRASEDELRGELRAVPELRLLSDDEVETAREDEIAAQNELNAVRAELIDAARANTGVSRGNRLADQAAARDYEEISRRYHEAVRRNFQVNGQIGYNRSLLLHQAMRQAAVPAGLKLGAGPSCQLDPSTAASAAKLSKELRILSFTSAAGVPFVGFKRGKVVIEGGGGVVISSRGISVNDPHAPTAAEKAENRSKAFQTWCDENSLEGMSGTVPILTQMLQIEEEPTRLVLVRELTRSKSEAATVELAIRAIADLSPVVRRAALAGLKQRPSSEYLPVLLRGLRYPWPPIADHAAVALHTLRPPEAIAPLVDFLDLPSPSAPVYDATTKQYTVREMVRLNHLRNCLLCHAPSANKDEGLVRGLVPTPGQPLSPQYYESRDGNFVRADITFLRQDFSITLPEEDAAPWPSEQRYDFVTRLRTVPRGELADLSSSSANYPQRDAVLYALRGLTGKDGGYSSALWRELLGPIAEKPKGQTRNPMLEKIADSPTDAERAR